MPQMAPISWLFLFVLFTLALILFCMMNYYNFLPSSPKSGMSKTLTCNQMTWKW